MCFKCVLFLMTFIVMNNIEVTNWWIYTPSDFDRITSNIDGVESVFMEDQYSCSSQSSSNCHSINPNLKSKDPYDNQCCLIKTEKYNSCLTLFSGKYHKTNLYSLDKGNDDFSYDCDGNGYKTYDSSQFSSNQKWETIIKEKYDCIYSKDEDTCKSNPKSFKENTKCCWFSNDDYLSDSCCFGLSSITDEEFNRTLPYLTLATLSRTSGEMEFRCYDKTDKVIKGKYNLDFEVSEMGSVEEKMVEELLSDDSLDILSRKQNFLKIKDYNKEISTSFHIWTASPYRDPKPFTISVKFSYRITESRIRNLETKTEEKLAKCIVENVDENTNLNISTSKCEFDNDEGYIAEKIEIQAGHDLIGNFEEGNNVATPGMNSSDDEINKMKDASYFTFQDSIKNLQSDTIEGKTTKDRKNVKFVLYHQKNDTIETIIGKASFLKDNQKINFTMEPTIDFNEGVTIIPNQMCKDEDGEYLYIINKIESSDENYNNIDDGDLLNHYKKKKSGLSTGAIIGIVIPCCVLLLISIILAVILSRKSSSSNIAVAQESTVN